MSEPMTEERLAELRVLRAKARSWAGLPGEVDDVFTDLADAVDEIDRLRAEIDRLLAELAAVTEERDRLRSLNLDVSPEPAPCSCSPGDQCSCAYDCDCRERLEHIFDEDEGWRATSKRGPAPEPAPCPVCGGGGYVTPHPRALFAERCPACNPEPAP